MSDDARWLDVARAILDGSPVAWDAVAQPSPDDPTSVDSMRLLAAVAEAHRQPRDAESGSWGSLELLDEIGSGAFGIVYRARDPALDRDVALKLLDARPGAAAIEEARLLARVRHPNVVTVHGAAEQDGRYGIWMEFVRGRTLAAIVAEDGPLSVDAATRVGVDLCRALGAVHAAGLVHGDIKAQNVMRGDVDGRIVVMDFGAGRFAEDSASARLAGTPLYLAPEVLKGAPADVRADVYSAGVLLYYLLTGEFPIDARDLSEVRAAHEAGRHVGLRERRRDVPRAFARVIERAISSSPASRIDSAAAMERALASVVLPRRLRRLAAWAVAAIVLVAGAGVTWKWSTAAARSPVVGPRDSILVGEFENRTGSPNLDGVIQAAVERELSNSQFVNPASPQRVDDALRAMTKPLDTPLQPDIAREVCRRDGGIRAYVTGRIDKIRGGYELTAFVSDPVNGHLVGTAEAEASTDGALQRATRELSNRIRADLGESADTIRETTQALEKVTPPSLQANRLFTQGLEAFDRQQLPQAESLFSAAIALEPNFASAHIWLAWTKQNMHKPRVEYVAAAERANDLAATASEREREWVLGSYYSLTGQHEQAMDHYEALLRRYPDDPWALGNLIREYNDTGRNTRETLDLATRLAVAEPLNFRIQTQVAVAFLEFDGIDAARPRFVRARQLAPSPDDNPDVQTMRAQISVLLFPAHDLWTQGRAADAAQVLDATAGRPEFAAEHDWTLNLLGKMRMALGQVRLGADAYNRISDAGLRRLDLAEVALGRADTAGIAGCLKYERMNDFAVASLLIRAGQLDDAASFLTTIRPAGFASSVVSQNRAWADDEIEQARGNRARITRALQAGLPWVNVMVGGRTFMYSETLARAAASIGNRAAAIKVLEETAPVGARAFGQATASGFHWMRAQKLLADLYREDNQIDKARAIERDLLARLAVADPDYPLLLELKQRDGT